MFLTTNGIWALRTLPCCIYHQNYIKIKGGYCKVRIIASESGCIVVKEPSKVGPVRLFNGRGHTVRTKTLPPDLLIPEEFSDADVFTQRVLDVAVDTTKGTERTFWLLVDGLEGVQLYRLRWIFKERWIRWTPLLPGSKKAFDYAEVWHDLEAMSIPHVVLRAVRKLLLPMGFLLQLPHPYTLWMGGAYRCEFEIGRWAVDDGFDLLTDDVTGLAVSLADRFITNYRLVDELAQFCQARAPDKKARLRTIGLVRAVAQPKNRTETIQLGILVGLWYK